MPLKLMFFCLLTHTRWDERECVTPDHFLRHSKGKTPKTGSQSPEETAPLLHRPLVNPPWFHPHLSSIYNVFLPPSTVSTDKFYQLLFGPTAPSLLYLSFPIFPAVSEYPASLSREMSREERK